MLFYWDRQMLNWGTRQQQKILKVKKITILEYEKLLIGVYIITLSMENKTIGQSKIIIE